MLPDRSLSAPAAIFLAALLLGAVAQPASAVPSFAVQTGQPCQDCHVGGFGPQLTPYGRVFKIDGYTRRTTSFSLPISMMAIASYVRTLEDQSTPPAEGFKRNDNLVLDQASFFIAGGLGAHVGAFVQTTYDGIAETWSWDNLDLRATTRGHVHDTDVVLGASLNNSPGVQDPWNTLPAWGFPYTLSGLAPSPAASPLVLGGGLAQNALGLTGYAWVNSRFYLDAGAYGSPGETDLERLGGDPFDPGEIRGLAPYGRAAFQATAWNGTLELGAFGMKADIFPGRDRSTGLTDDYTDLGVDASYYRRFGSGDVFALNGRYIRERQRLEATCVLAGLAANCADTHLDDLRGDVSYYWRDKIGVTIAAFDTSGPANAFLYSESRTFQPDSSGMTLQLDGTAFGESGSPLGPRFSMRFGAQYTHYVRFNGAVSNYDGTGADASDNDTARVFLWAAY